MSDRVFTVVKQDGKLRLVAPKAYQKFVAMIGDGEERQMVIREPVRGLKRNAKLHGVCAEVAAELGWHTDEFKEFIVTKIRPLEEDPVTGWVRRQRTSTMTDAEIDALVMEIKAWTQHQFPGFVFEYDEVTA